jgi:peptidoglycan/xylan/chitin deacetylase (PgdA/CDA1 family)
MTPPVPVLMYHEIAEPTETTSRLAVPPDAFAAQLAELHAGGFTTVTAAELTAAVAGKGSLPDRAIVLTFDDGFEDFHRRAMPLLDRYGFSATVFVNTGWVQDAGPLPAGRRPGRMLSWTQIAEAASAGIEVAAHSHLHPRLDQLPGTLLREELRASKARLEDKLGAPVAGLAYPFGYHSARVRREASVLGYGYACAVRNVMMSAEPDLFALPRLTVRRSTRMPAFRQIIRGASIQAIFGKEHVLTAGYAMVRRATAAWGSVSRGE